MSKVSGRPPNPLVPRGPHGRLLPGNLNNPSGRPRTGTSFTMMIREHVPLDTLLEQTYLMALGHPMIKDLTYLREQVRCQREGLPPPEPPSHLDDPIYPTQTERLNAIKFLIEWGYQKPVQQIEMTTSTAPVLDLSKLSQEELDDYERIQRKMAGLPNLIEILETKNK